MPNASVLIVEDDQLQALALARILRTAGLAVSLASDAVQAVASARRDAPDLILLDLGLPAGGGLLVLERLRVLASTCVTPVIVITGGFVDRTQRQALARDGVETILTKPVAEETLMAAVLSAMQIDDQVGEA